MKLRTLPNRKFKTEVTDTIIEIEGFTRYLVNIEGTPMKISSTDETPKKLSISVSLDGTLTISLEKTEAREIDLRTLLLRKLPRGYEFCFETESAKIIRGVRGRYLYFRHKEKRDYVAFSVGASGRHYKITLGNLHDPTSKLGVVLQELPDRPFLKAHLTLKLPSSIVENRQPIKAALDVLEEEGYVKKIGTKGVSEQFIRTDKPIPSMTKQSLITGSKRIEPP